MAKRPGEYIVKIQTCKTEVKITTSFSLYFKVIDEAFTVLYHVQHTKTLQPMSELLRELRDISSMAIEHFDEEIVPTLKKKRSLQVPPCFSSDGKFNGFLTGCVV